ncbi:hypothetical protein [Salsipaludibacter albus]|uniref:hypothetical protein n=1 Tax=Salsipaludibacter albus TaxID=2849650 RepID=UPI001EE3A475|nr:hypothetical protein [Salsipaludibacter albus]
MGRWTRDNWWLVLAALAGTALLFIGVGLPLEDRTLGAVLGGIVHAVAGLAMLAGIAVRRRPGRRALGDLMIGVSALPLAAWFWTIVAPLLALAVMIPAFRDAADAGTTSETPGSARPA